MCYVREKKKKSTLIPPTNFAAAVKFFTQEVVGSTALRAPAPIEEGAIDCAESLSNLIPGMDGFWLEALACQAT
jgi:hypothetical protein